MYTVIAEQTWVHRLSKLNLAYEQMITLARYAFEQILDNSLDDVLYSQLKGVNISATILAFLDNGFTKGPVKNTLTSKASTGIAYFCFEINDTYDGIIIRMMTKQIVSIDIPMSLEEMDEMLGIM